MDRKGGHEDGISDAYSAESMDPYNALRGNAVQGLTGLERIQGHLEMNEEVNTFLNLKISSGSKKFRMVR